MFEEIAEDAFDIFSGLLFNALKGFAYMFFVAFVLISPSDKTGEVDSDVEILITVSWPDGLEDDVDVYVEDPAGNLVWYHQREAGLMHLDRDDRGLFKDVILINDREVANLLNQETVSIRGLLDGEYTVNLVHYIAASTEPVPVTVRVEKLNPMVRILYYGETVLEGSGEERTVVRFTLAGDEVSDVNNREKSLVAATRGAGPAQPPAAMDPGTGAEVAAP
jgi:hypothetical protein